MLKHPALTSGHQMNLNLDAKLNRLLSDCI